MQKTFKIKKEISAIDLLHWILGVSMCGFGICLSTRAGFGLSMISAPPYIMHVFLKQFFPWYTQGRSEYIWEAFLLILMCIAIRCFRPKYLFSFFTAVVIGFLIDGFFAILGGNTVYTTMPGRIAAYVIGTCITCCAIAFVFRTKIPGQVYELIVVQVSERYSLNKEKVKLVHDVAMFVISIALALLLTHSLAGLGVGTIITTFVNAPLIKMFGMMIDKVEKRGTCAVLQ